MQGFSVSAVILATLVSASAASANHYQKYLPNKEGNQFTYYRANPNAKFAPWTLPVDYRSGGMFHMDAFPGFESGVWLYWSGNTLWAWSWEQYQWVQFLRFGAAVGTTYTVTMDGIWKNTEVHIKSKNHSVFNPHLNLTHTGVVHFVFNTPGLADAGIGEFLFAKNYGLVYWSETTFTGPTTGWLGAGQINGSKLGPVTYELLESGQFTNFTSVPDHTIYLINSKKTWEWFYKKHNTTLGGAVTVPQVDFTKHTVAAVFLGQRNTGGYSVNLSGAWYGYPNNKSVRLKAFEVTPAGPVIQVITHPYAFYVLDAKFTTGTDEWDVILNK